MALLMAAGRAAGDPLPAGADKEFIQTRCTACHGIERVLGSGGSVQNWHDRILRMVRWGAKVAPDQVEALAQYLARALPPRPRPPAQLAFFANITVGAVEYRPLQLMLRGAGVAQSLGGRVRMRLDSCAGLPLRAGLRARLTPGAGVGSGSMAVVESVQQQGAGCLVVLHSGQRPAGVSQVYRAEVQVDSGVHLSIPNSAVLEDDGVFRVFVQRPDGAFESREVRLGIQDDHYTAVISGLRAGEQVVSTGGFFVDAEARLKGGIAP
jgi:hypothetical protein